MFGHHLKIAFRSLLRSKLQSLINILGLSLGISCCLLIMVHILDELSYDQFHEKADRIYRVKYELKRGANEFSIARTPVLLAPQMKESFPQIEHIARVFPRSMSLEVDASENQTGIRKSFEERQIFFADSSVLNVFTFDFTSGDPTHALDNPYSVILSESMAQKYFDESNPIGKTLIAVGQHNFKVTGVFKDFPTNSHIHPGMVFPYSNMYDVEPENSRQALRQNLAQNWMISHSATYLSLHEDASAKEINEGFRKFLQTHGDDRFSEEQTFSLQPITDIHLKDPDTGAQMEAVSSMTMVYLFLGIAFITLLIACINFINLSTAAYLKRATEIGVRKVLGAEKGGLVRQFLSESAVMSVLSYVLAILWVVLLLPVMNDPDRQKLYSRGSVSLGSRNRHAGDIGDYSFTIRAAILPFS